MIIAGQGTVALELLEQVPDLGTVFVPMGGGGLIAGVSAAIKQSRPRSAWSASSRSRRRQDAGGARRRPPGDPRPHRRASPTGIMNMRAGDVTFAHVQRFVDDLVAVPDDAIAEAVGWLYRQARLVVEPSGAATTAAVTLGLGGPVGTVAAVVSGGNVQPEKFAKYIGAGASAYAHARGSRSAE